MALAIATNTGALMASASATSVNKDMETSMERLSTGKRINSAKDDAAGVAIASRLSSEIRGTNQAIRNAQDGQALINTAEGAHKEVESILQRMRELAVQAANDTNDATDRENLAAEMTQLTTEIDRIAEVTSWAGQTLLAAGDSTSDFNFQVGSGTSDDDTIAVKIGGMSAEALGIAGDAVNPTVTIDVDSSAAGTISTSGSAITFGGDFNAGDTYTAEVNGVSKTITVASGDQYQDDASGIATQMKDAFQADITAAQTAINDGSPDADDLRLAGVTVVDDGLGGITFTQAASIVSSAVVGDDNAAGENAKIEASGNTFTISDEGDLAENDEYTVTINGESLTYAVTADEGFELDTLAGHAAGLAAAISENADLKAAGYSATSDAGVVTVVREDLDMGSVSTVSTGGVASLTQDNGTFTVAGGVATGDEFELTIDGETVSVAMEAGDGFDRTVEGAAAKIAQAIDNADIKGLTVTNKEDGKFTLGRFGSVDITDTDAANAAADAIEAAISEVNTQRANLGAVSNRLDNTVSNLTNVAINLEGGKGRIEDADFAAESTSLAKSQILQQASTAMLAQANASKQNVLSLLQG